MAAAIAPHKRAEGSLTRLAYRQAAQPVPQIEAALLVPSKVAGRAWGTGRTATAP